MLEIFARLADRITYDLLGLESGTRFASSVQFFIEDTTKILFLLVVMIYVIALMRASLNLERVRNYLQQKHRLTGYVLGSGSGAITPFCSCSSIPLFLGFTSAAIGNTMAFLLTSPIINEVAVIMLWTLRGWKFTLAYILIGLAVGIIGSILLDATRAERYLKDFAARAYRQAASQAADAAAGTAAKTPWLTLADRHRFAMNELQEIAGRIWKWVLIGVGPAPPCTVSFPTAGLRKTSVPASGGAYRQQSWPACPFTPTRLA